ncbi:hypothetical protein D3C71_496950 [compost metagenome]
MTNRFEELHEAFMLIAEKKDQAERVIAADLPGDGLFTVMWGSMIVKLIDAGMAARDERTAGNFLTMLTEELPGTMNYAEAQAEMNPNSDAARTVAALEEMLELAARTLGDEPYTDMDAEWRHPPAERRKPGTTRPR